MEPDVEVLGWAVELLLHDPDKESIAKQVLEVAPLSKQNPRLNKTLLLRTIESEATDSGSVSEAILDALESIEILDREQGIPIRDSMRAAYCAVATDCAVKFLVYSRGKPTGKYHEAVDRIWRGRVKLLEGSEGCELVSAELKERRDEVEAGVWDTSVSKKFARMNSRSDALISVAKYVKEAREMMGPPFIACAVRLGMYNAASLGSEGDDKVVAAENVGNVSEPEAQNVDGANNVGDRFENETPQKANGANAGHVQVQVENDNNVMGSWSSPPNATHGVFSFEPATKEKETPRSSILRDAEDMDMNILAGKYNHVSSAEVRKVQGELESSVVALQVSGPVKIRDAGDMDMNILSGKYNHVSSAEVRKVQGELVSSVVALQASVTDPLPYALRVSETVRSELEMRPANHVSGEDGAVANPSVDKNTEPDQSDTNNNGNQISSHQNDAPKPCGKEIDAPNASVVKGKGTEFVQTSDVNPGNPSCSYQNNVSRVGLMERNSTAHTYEWNDSLGLSPAQRMNGEGLRLHSPKRIAVSPLKKSGTKPIAKRRKIKRWSLHEEEALRNGVERYGKGNWKYILDAYEDVFDERTQVDLKDKWRNMTK